MESLSVDTIPAGVPEDAAGESFFGMAAGEDGAFCCASGAGVFAFPFVAGFAPVFWAGLEAVFPACLVTAFCGAGFTAGSDAAAVSISSRLHSGMWADALQERSSGYSGCLE